MRAQPAGTTTFFFADIEGSTRLLQTLGPRYSSVLTELRELLRTTFRQWRGTAVDVVGDSLFATFSRAKDALAAAVDAQRAIRAHRWPGGVELRVRIGLHTGEPLKTETGYVGIDVNHAARICAAGHGGQILLSDTTRALVEHDLPEGLILRDLGEHLLKDLVKRQHLYQAVAADLQADFPALRTLATLPNNLPIQLTSFIGREREMDDVAQSLRATRLVTLTGAGGCGKTRLALHVASDMLDEFADGVWLVELATLPDPALVPQQVALSLGIREQPGRPIAATVQDYLHGRRLLLVLDNCEHLVTACAQIAEGLLRACPDLRMLITSREPLAIAGETVWQVPPLSTPPLERLPPADQLTHYEAVTLFVERARAVVPGFSLTGHSALAVALLCYWLDGMPLAIELAAARVKVLSVDEIASRLDDRFRLLTGGSRTALPRHQTLRATMDWSYDLLAEPERVLFRRLSVFAGGFTLEATEAVCAAQGLPPRDVLDLLTRLVDKSLVTMEERAGEARYRMLETVRRYSQDKLLDSGEAPAMRQRHRDWYLHLVAQAEPELQGPAQKAWLDRLQVEHNNLRAALDSSESDPRSADDGVQMGAGLWWFWFVRGYWTEGRQRLEKALAMPGTTPAHRAKALSGAAVLAGCQGDYRRATAWGNESLELYKAIGDKRGIPFAINALGYLARQQGAYARAAALCEQSLVVARDVQDAWGTALALFILGEIALIQGDYPRARALSEESLALYRKRGDTWGIGFAQNNLGLVARQQGELDQAERLCAESLALFRELEDIWGMESVLRSLGIIAHGKGDYPRAAALYEESLALCRKLGDKWGIASSLRGLGLIAHKTQRDQQSVEYLQESLAIFRELNDARGIAETLQSLGMLARDHGDLARAIALWQDSVSQFARVHDKLGIAQCVRLLTEGAAARGEFARAARLSGALESLQATLGVAIDRYEQEAYDRGLAKVRDHLAAERFAAVRAQGQALSLDRVIEYACTDTPAGTEP